MKKTLILTLLIISTGLVLSACGGEQAATEDKKEVKNNYTEAKKQAEEVRKQVEQRTDQLNQKLDQNKSQKKDQDDDG